MSIVVRCQCGRSFAAQPHLAGKQVNCPVCGSPIVIPVPQQGLQQTGTLEPLDAPSDGGFWSETVSAASAAPAAPGTLGTSPFGASAPRKRRSSSLPLIIGGVVAAVMIVFLVAGLFVWSIVSGFVKEQREWTTTMPQEDYADARRSFQIKLVRRGAPPQDWEPLSTPSGAQRIDYQSGNLTLAAFVDPPPDDGSTRPGLLFLHGGFAYGDGDWEMPQPYRDAGYIVMTPTLRGENGQAGEFELYFGEVDDVLAAADTLAALPYVDEDQIFVVGHSAGGSLAALAAMASDRFRAAASFSGCMDQRMNSDIAPYQQSDKREVQIRSPQYYASSFKCPARLYFGSEEVFLAPSTQGTETRAKKAGLDVRAQRVPGDHFTSVTPAIRHSIIFFRQHLRTIPAPRLTTPPIAVPSLPSISPPSIPAPPRPSFTPPRHPSLSRSRAVVVFEIRGYEGRSHIQSAARRALVGIPWVDPVRIKLDESAGTLTVGVRGASVSTAAAQSALERAGFQIGSSTYRGTGQ